MLAKLFTKTGSLSGQTRAAAPSSSIGFLLDAVDALGRIMPWRVAKNSSFGDTQRCVWSTAKWRSRCRRISWCIEYCHQQKTEVNKLPEHLTDSEPQTRYRPLSTILQLGILIAQPDYVRGTKDVRNGTAAGSTPIEATRESNNVLHGYRIFSSEVSPSFRTHRVWQYRTGCYKRGQPKKASMYNTLN